MLVKILGGIDLFAAFVFLALIFGTEVPFQFLIFPAILLLVKGLFVVTGDVLSVVDLFSAAVLVIAIFITPFSILLWIPAFLLLSKGVLSFI